MRAALALLAIASYAQDVLPGTARLAPHPDPARRFVDGIRLYLEAATRTSPATRRPTRERLREVIGAVDPRVPFSDLELTGDTARPALRWQTPHYKVYAVRFPVFDGVTAEGLLFEPNTLPVARVVALPDPDQLPEYALFAHRLARNECQVLALALIDRRADFSGNPRIRMTAQPHREWIYRMAFPAGRTIIGYEVQKALAAVDWFSKQSRRLPIGIWGAGEGALIALHAAALDPRIQAAAVANYFGPREGLWTEPIYRNLFGYLRDFGDAELAGLVAPRRLIVERGAIPRERVLEEVGRAARLNPTVAVEEDATQSFLEALGAGFDHREPIAIDFLADLDRVRRQFDELVAYTQKLLAGSARLREALWAKSGPEAVRERVLSEMIGRVPEPPVDRNPRSLLTYRDARWNGYEVAMDILPGVTAYGVLLLPKDIAPGERRPIVVAQHGLEGRPQSLFHVPENDKDFTTYQNFAAKLADRGYVVFAPQNFYRGGDHFRQAQRMAHPLGLTMYSFTIVQHRALLEWLSSLPFADPKRIGFYGLSYGGRTALMVPPFLNRYALAICSGNFNEWIHKLTTIDERYSYMFTLESEMWDWNQAWLANHAELANLMAPRPFMVERGHRDGVGIDEWVAFEFAKVKRHYDEAGIGDRAGIEYFDGIHQIHGVGTFEFLKRHLGR